MKKKEKWIKRSVLGSMAALAVMAVVGCAEEVTQIFSDSTKVEVTASFGSTDSQSLTRAADGLDNATSGFSLLTETNSSSKVRVMVDANNGNYSSYDYSITGTTAITAPITPPAFPSGVNSVNVYGWYPNVSLTDFSVNANQSSTANYCLSDLMVAAGATCVRSGSSVTQSANLSFAHVMSKVKVSLTLASGVTVKAVKLKRVKPTVTVTPQLTSNAVTSFTLGDASGSAGDITLLSGGSLTSASAAADKVLCGVFPPQEITSGALLEITANYNSGSDQTITYSLSAAKSFARANEYTMNISLSGTNVTTGTVSLGDWTGASGTVNITGGGGGGDAPTLSPTSLSLTFRSGTGSITPSVVGTAWTGMSANTSVATVSGTGPITVTPAGVGSTTIYVWPTAGVSSGFSTASCPVTVSALTMQTSNSSNNGYTTFSSIADQLYTGSAITPTPTVTVKGSDGNVNLVSGTDFDYSYSNNTAAGTNTATVTVTGKGNYTGSASKTFSIVTCTGTALSSATVGQIICSHGKAHAATTGALSCGGTKVAIVAYKGSAGSADTSTGSSSYVGLALAITDVGGETATKVAWYTANSGTCITNAQSTDWATATGTGGDWMKGIDNTNRLATAACGSGHVHAAAQAAVNFESTLAHPTGTSQWFLPTIRQWKIMLEAIKGSGTLSTSSQDAFKTAAFADWFSARGGKNFEAGDYWSSVEYSTNGAWNMYFFNGRAYYNNKSNTYRVRPVLAF